MNRIFQLLLLLPFLLLSNCKSKSVENDQKNHMEIQGHRGDRGNFPENTIPAFLSAVEKGVDVLELDVVVSQDRKVVVSHEPVMSSEYMLTPSGKPVSEEEEENLNLYRMDYESIRQYDAGSRGNENFPAQEKEKTFKPLLVEVFDTVEEYIRSRDLRSVKYNIEIKSEPSQYGDFMPFPEEFVNLVMQDIADKGVGDKVNIQSFDPAVLNLLRKINPKVPIAFLVESGGVTENLQRLDFRPEIYSPHFSLLSSKAVDSIKSLGMKVIPWTVNEEEDIQHMIELGVDGIISDYPERVIKAMSNEQ